MFQETGFSFPPKKEKLETKLKCLFSTLNMQISEWHWTGMVIFKDILEVGAEGGLESVNYATQIVQDMKAINSSEAMQLKKF